MTLTNEQKVFLQDALKGNNVLVDACVGSGKTTAIQALCNAVPKNKSVLYLTYSRLLKVDAQSKIKNFNTTVQNYHGFAYRYAKVAPQEQIKQFLLNKPEIEHYDLLILDEYQDIDQEISDMLTYIKCKLPNIQIIAVGDMQQKIWDKTKLDVSRFIIEFLGEKHTNREFTACFRLSQDHANMLSRVWEKPIIGVNQDCIVEYMAEEEVFTLLLDNNPCDILCLGSRSGRMAKLLNDLENAASHKFNKHTVFASIRDRDSHQPNLSNDVAIFTTFDSCKGLERKICIVFDFDENYWGMRLNHHDQSYEILRNIFCVAASRGKDRIVFVKGNDDFLSEKVLSTPRDKSLDVADYNISVMFDFKYDEDRDRCFKYLNIQEITNTDKTSVLDIKRNDGLIDISLCIGIYQEASFFEDYCIDKAIENYLSSKEANDKERMLYTHQYKRQSLEEKVLFLTSLEMKHDRYRNQVKVPFITDEEKTLMSKRLSEYFSPHERVQVPCELLFFISNPDKENREDVPKPYFYARGLADVVRNNIAYELKFVSHIDSTHFLQLACYVTILGLEKGILINTFDNRIYEVTVSEKSNFLEAVAHTITKQRFANYKITSDTTAEKNIEQYYQKQREEEARIDIVTARRGKARVIGLQQPRESLSSKKKSLKEYSKNIDENAVMFALIDVETSYSNNIISIGIVISDDISFKPRSFKYYRILEHENVPAMFTYAMELGDFSLNPSEYEIKASYLDVIEKIKELLSNNKVKHLFAYNASFDKGHLPELREYYWHDIMEKAAYRQTNKKIPANSEFYGTGRLKKGYGVEAIYRLLADDTSYNETHNALMDALDELEIMRHLEYRVIHYGVMR